MQTTLQTILLPTEERYLECPGLFYRPGALNIPGPDVLPYGKYARWAGGFFPGEPLPVASTNTDRVSFDFKKQALYVAEDNTVSLCTYFNMLSMRKWLSYTYVEDFAVELDLKGEGEIIIYELAAPDVGEHRQYLWGATSQVVKRVPFSCKRRQKVNIPINMSTTTCVGVDIQASTAVSFFGGRWLGQVEAEQVRPVDICILTTTFQKEEYITANLKLLQEGIWSTATQARKAKEIPCDIAEHLDVIVVDNGKTLEAAQVENEHVSLFPNDNVGGAGGFARGMIEALRSGKNYTHALIMDDDISMHPEAFRRTYTLLRLLRPEFENIYIAGAMLQLDCPNTQHEDIGYIHRNGYFTPRKGRLDLYDVRVCVQNEVLWDPIYNQYAAWWYCCVPMRDVREDNLPLPFFVRGDDVEFALRNQAQVITLAGICVWHVSFSKKFSASMEYYQVIRNSLILQACVPSMAPAAFFRQAHELVLFNIYQYAYDYADLILDAVEDFMNGPGILKEPRGLDIIKAKGAYNEVLEDIANFEDLDVELDLTDDEALMSVRHDIQVSMPKRLIRMLTRNGHRRAPAFFYREGVGTTPYDWDFTTGNQSGYKQILAINPVEKTAVLRTRDEDRFKHIMKRLKEVTKRFKNDYAQIEAQWQAEAGTLRSIDFWKNYLGID